MLRCSGMMGIGFGRLQHCTLLGFLSIIMLLLQKSQMTLSLEGLFVWHVPKALGGPDPYMEEGDSCVMNGVNGVCATACKVLETGFKNGLITRNDFVHCGYTRFEEIICCPVYLKTNADDSNTNITPTTATPTTTSTTTTTTTTTAAPTTTTTTTTTSTTTERLPTQTSTAKPDFWLHLLNQTTTTTTTTSTTPEPLIYKGKELDSDVEYIDLNSLLQNNRVTGQIPSVNNNNNMLNAGGGQAIMQNQRQFDNMPQQQQRQPPGQAQFQQQQQRQTPGQAQFQQQPQQQQRQPNGRGRNNPSNLRRNMQFPPNRANRNNLFRPQQQFAAPPSNDITEPFAESYDSGALPARSIFPNGQQQAGSTNPIAQINEQLINAGMDIVEAKLEHVDRQWQNQQFNFMDRTPTTQGVQQPNTGPFVQNQIQFPGSVVQSQPPNMPNTQFQRPGGFVQNPPFANFQAADMQHQGPVNFAPDQPSHNFVGPNGPNIPFQSPAGFAQNQQFTNFQQPNTQSQGALTPNQPFESTANSFANPAVRRPTTNPFAPFEFRPSDDVVANDLGMNDNSINNDDGGNRFSVTSDPSIVRTDAERPSIEVCKRIEAKLGYDLTPHILDGIPAERGEFPHAALIQFSDENVICGGSLIDQRFVLTAAHCVINARRQPIAVRLGMVNIANSREGEEIRIRGVHIHPDYNSKLKYNDIALVELEREAFNWETVDFDVIGPACLYTNQTNPPANKPLIAIGWGLTNVTTRTQSKRLLKVDLKVHDTSDCDKQYRAMDHSTLPQGIVDTQLCAFSDGKDACAGDSGGPLNIGEDVDRKYYQIVGIVSTGFSCGTNTPGLYTRVAAFLDYVESVVWPTNS